MATRKGREAARPLEPEDESQEVPEPDEPPPPKAPRPKRQPIRTIRLGNIRAAIWENWGEFGAVYNVTLSRSYRDSQQQWQNSSSFGLNDLLVLSKVADLAHTWIY